MVTDKKILDTIEKLRPIDDILFEMLARNPKVSEEIEQVIQADNTICVDSVITQSVLRNFCAKSVTLDALCYMAGKPNTVNNIEVQRANNDNHLKRVRYNGASITTRYTEPGMDYKYVPDVNVIYITDKDFLKQGLTTYHIGKVIQENGHRVDDGFNEIFVNAEIDDGSMIAALMKCFLQTMVDDERFPELSKEMKKIKQTQEGRESMCKIIDELLEQEAAEYKAQLERKEAEYKAQLERKESEIASKDDEIAGYKAYIAELLSKLSLA